MMKLFEAARRVSVPLLAIRTADQCATQAEILAASGEYPVAQWDAARGITPAATPGSAACKLAEAALKKAGIKPEETIDFAGAMIAAQRLPELAILIAHSASRQLHSQEPGATAANVQAVANLRDQFKLNFRMLVLLGPGFIAPQELDQDIVVLDHALPDPAALRTIIEELRAGIKSATGKLAAPVLEKAVDAVSGLSAFAAEQVTAMSFDETGSLDLDALWERKRVAIEQTKGLSVYRGGETFDDLRGLESVKARLRSHVSARTPVGVVVWIDEGADVFSSVESDTSNVKTDQQRALLVEMEEHNWRGMIAVGVPGSGKSAIARAFGNEASVPTIQVDFGDMENKFVGESEANLRSALNVIKAVGRGHAFFVLTCNSLKGIRPQFQRRFRRGIFFFDMPTPAERDAIWALYTKRYDLPTQARPDDDGWTGAEIRECCESAWDTNSSLVEAARFIIPVSRSRATEIEAMRAEAHGRFLDASHPGAYEYRAEPMAKQVRAIRLPKTGKESVN